MIAMLTRRGIVLAAVAAFSTLIILVTTVAVDQCDGFALPLVAFPWHRRDLPSPARPSGSSSGHAWAKLLAVAGQGDDGVHTGTPTETPMLSAIFHHSAIRTRNITLAIQFYSLFGFEPTAKFRAGPAKAAWLEQRQASGAHDQGTPPPCRIELIEIPPEILKEPEGKKKRALDLFARPDFLGHNHLALDVTHSARQLGCERNLAAWMDHLNERSVALFGKTMRVALPPSQQIISSTVYDLAFVYDADGALVELLCQGVELPQKMSSGWDLSEWTGFLGAESVD